MESNEMHQKARRAVENAQRLGVASEVDEDPDCSSIVSNCLEKGISVAAVFAR